MRSGCGWLWLAGGHSTACAPGMTTGIATQPCDSRLAAEPRFRSRAHAPRQVLCGGAEKARPRDSPPHCPLAPALRVVAWSQQVPDPPRHGLRGTPCMRRGSMAWAATWERVRSRDTRDGRRTKKVRGRGLRSHWSLRPHHHGAWAWLHRPRRDHGRDSVNFAGQPCGQPSSRSDKLSDVYGSHHSNHSNDVSWFA